MTKNEAKLYARIAEVVVERDEARLQLAEAAEAVRLLMAWGRARYQDDMTMGDPGTFDALRAAYRALPAWVRKEVEK